MSTEIQLEPFLDATIEALQEMRKSLDDLKKKTPSGLWRRVAEKLRLPVEPSEVKYSRTAVSRYFVERKEELIDLLADKLDPNVPPGFNLLRTKRKSSEQRRSERYQKAPERETVIDDNETAPNQKEVRMPLDTISRTEFNEAVNTMMAKVWTSIGEVTGRQTELTEDYSELLQKQSDLQRQSVTRESVNSALTDLEDSIRRDLDSLSERVQIVSDNIVAVSQKEEPEGGYELCPEPARSGKGHDKKRPKIWGTMDQHLKDLLDAEAERRGVTFSRLLDTAVWNLLGRPALSFQIHPEEQERETKDTLSDAGDDFKDTTEDTEETTTGAETTDTGAQEEERDSSFEPPDNEEKEPTVDASNQQEPKEDPLS